MMKSTFSFLHIVSTFLKFVPFAESPMKHTLTAPALHAPQSAAQELHVSVASQVPLPQTAWQEPQSCGHELHVSLPSHALFAALLRAASASKDGELRARAKAHAARRGGHREWKVGGLLLPGAPRAALT